MESEFPLRINKFLAKCGHGSRRYCETLILQGKVALNGKTVNDLGQKVAITDSVSVNGKKCHIKNTTLIFAFNKPKKSLCSFVAEPDKPTIYEFIPPKFKKLHYVGRLDYMSHGLIFLTNNGDITQWLINPSSNIIRRYRVKIKPLLKEEHKIKLEKGIKIGPRMVSKPTKISIMRNYFEIELTEGKNREIRKMMELFRYKVLDLQRISFGSIKLGDLPPGKLKILSNTEINSLISEVNPIK